LPDPAVTASTRHAEAGAAERGSGPSVLAHTSPPATATRFPRWGTATHRQPSADHPCETSQSPWSSLRRPRAPADTRGPAPDRMARAGAAPAGARCLASARRTVQKTPAAVDATAPVPSASNATASVGPNSKAPPSCFQSRPPLVELSRRVSVA
jgi:hypothetical protein